MEDNKSTTVKKTVKSGITFGSALAMVISYTTWKSVGWAIFIPEGVSALPKDIINQPDLQVYVKDFGKNKGDLCLVAQVRNKIVGAVWVRIMNDYGHIDNETPSFAISLLKEYRNYGIGTELMKQMLTKLKLEGYKQASLSVQKMNYAVRMYKKIGFEIVDENDEEYIMICKL